MGDHQPKMRVGVPSFGAKGVPNAHPLNVPDIFIYMYYPYGSMTPFYCVAFSTKVARKCD